jgi:Uma2 family endonuclease
MEEAFMTMAELLTKLGGVPAERVLLDPTPGTAKVKDVIAVERREGRICELVDGVLVEKAMGLEESFLAMWMGFFLQDFLVQNDLGILAGESGPFRLMPRLVRIPDISFVSWDQLPNRELPRNPIPPLFPDLAVEVLGPSNTKREMDRKIREYFLSGTRLVWIVNPIKRCVRVYTAPDESRLFQEDQPFDGGDVLPGFRLSLRDVFARMPTIEPKKRRKR